jgi:hypothetical protein
MSRIYSFFVFLLINISCFSYADNFIPWGAWNPGDKDEAIFRIAQSTGKYYVTNGFLSFDPVPRGYPWITYEGGNYKIIEVISDFTDNSYIFILECTGAMLDEEGELTFLPMLGKVIMHIIDEDHMWLELDYSDSITHPQFPPGYFKGSGVIFWRAEKASDQQ